MNPHVDAARTRVRGWARRLGLPDDSAAHTGLAVRDPGLLAACVHPRCGPAELRLVTDWYTWACLLGDHFRRTYAEPRDVTGARAYLERLTSFLADGAREPATPVERGLADLWPRTVRGRSGEWRGRFARSVRGLLREKLWELRCAEADRVPNPVEYLRVRRAGAASWAACLTERARGAELPARLAAARPLRMITDAFADAVRLGDDLYETGDADVVTSGVLVLAEFLGRTPGEAAETTRDLMTARTRAFEHAVATELPTLYDDHTATAGERAAVEAYAGGLREWQAGREAWRHRPGHPQRPKSAPDAPPPRPAGVPGPCTPGYPFRLPRLATPWKAVVSRHLDSARRYAKAWAYEMGMIGPLAVRGDGVWTDARFDAQEFALFAALTHPVAERDRLHLLTLWEVWAFALDDFVVAEFAARRDLPGARAFVAGLPRFLGERAPAPANCVERGLADLWARTAPRLPPGARERLASSVPAFAEGDLAGALRRRVPDPVEYAEARRLGAGAGLSLNLGILTSWPEMPAELLDSRPVRELLAAFADTAGFRNDIFSYRRETELEFDANNGVLVIRQFFGCGLQQAVEIAADVAGASLREFSRVAEEELPALLDEHAVDDAGREQVRSLVRGLELWLSGHLEWHARTRRHTDAAGPARAVAGPVRLGTPPSSVDTHGHTARP